ncbi:MAG TPA: divalent metal cation transporter [Candidatus Bathyarchaeia archaeon]|nr:divalent metal cation transporter [Candidatus Bathyarchaeia archaeon]
MFLVILGPGMITANVDNDAGGITTYSLAGAHFGLDLVWTLIPMTIALIVTQEVCARMGVVTGKGLADLIREQFGVKAAFWVMVALILTNLGNTMAEFSGIAAASEIFGVSRYVAVFVSATLVWVLVIRGNNRVVERIFLVACLVYVAYPISGFIAGPPWREVARASVVPPLRFDHEYLTMLIGLVGTTIAPWMQFYQQSAVVEKGISPDHYAYEKWDVIIGCCITDIVALFIILACASTLHANHVQIVDASDAARALRPLAGDYAAGLFAFGLFNASLFAASVLPLSTAFYVCEAFGWESGVSQSFSAAPQFYVLYTALIVFGAGVVMIPHFPLVPVMFLSQVANGMVLPLVLVFMVRLANRRDLMGKFINSRAGNVAIWTTTVVMTVLTVIALANLIGVW